jgi:hypothetical protein
LFSITKYVITLAPPLLPFPLLFMASLILYVSLPKAVPAFGLTDNSLLRSESSVLREGNFFTRRLASFLNLSTGMTL